MEAAAAAEHLRRCGYDLHAALTSLEGEQYTLTERILRRYRNQPAEALSRLALAIEHAYGLRRSFWLDLAELQRLNPEQYCFMLLHERLSYEGWETFSSAVYHHPAEVDAQLRQSLQLPEVANCLRAHRRRQDQLARQYAGRPRQQLWDASSQDSHLQQHEERFNVLRPELIDRLLTYVRQHLTSFP